MSENEPAESPTVLLQRVHRWRMAFFGLVILFAGMVIGGAATLVTVGGPDDRPPGPDPGRIIGQISEDLHLSPEQRAKLKPIIEKRMKMLREIRDKARPQIEEQLRLMHEEISALLTQEQLKRWNDEVARFQRGLWRDRGGPGRGPGPGGRRGPGPGPGGGPFRDRGERPDGRRWREYREGRPPGPNRPEGPPPMPPMEPGPGQPQPGQDANDIE